MDAQLREYVSRHGFVHETKWYFRTTWMAQKLRSRLEQAGTIRRTGSGTELENMGIKIPKDRGAKYGATSLFYETASE